jgi:hypothetical protein
VSKSDYPKRTLEELFSGSPRANERPLDVWADIAKALDPSRCNSRSNTGLEAFVNEVRAELGPLFSASAPPRS